MSRRAQFESLAQKKFKAMRPTCSCGGDSRDLSWHHEGCSLEAAWDRAWEDAKDEIPHCWAFGCLNEPAEPEGKCLECLKREGKSC